LRIHELQISNDLSIEEIKELVCAIVIVKDLNPPVKLIVITPRDFYRFNISITGIQLDLL